jgi:hypothetical protein
MKKLRYTESQIVNILKQNKSGVLMLVVLFCSLIFKAVSRRWGSFRDFLLRHPWQSVILVHSEHPKNHTILK